MQVHVRKTHAHACACRVALMGEQVYVPRMSNTQAATPAAVRLKPDAYAAWMSGLKLAGDERQAEYLGISRSNLGKVRRGEIKPGEQFIAACLAAYDGTFEELFEVAS